jgi:hypothetical protein
MTDTTFGMGVSLSRFDLATAVDAADECDELLSGIYATPDGSQKRFTCNGILFATDSHKTNINKILSSMNGMLTYTNGQFVVRAGAYEAPSVYLDEDNLAGAVSVKTSVERSDRFNTVTGTFIDPTQNHKATEFPEVYITSARLRDGNEVLTKNVQLPMTNDRYMAQRIAHKLIQQSDQQKVVTFPTNLSGMQVAVGDRVAISLDEFSWSNKPFICLGWTLSDSGNGGVNLILREDNSSSYDDMTTSEYSEITAEGTIEEGFRGVPDPQDLKATAGLKSIELNWDNPENTSDILFIEVFASPDSSWANRVKIGEVDGTQFTHDESNAADPILIDDTRYYWIRARAMPTGESAIAVSDRNPPYDTSPITATVGALPWDDVAGDAKPEDNANNTYIDGSGDIQGVSSGAGTSVDNSLNIGKTLALCLNQAVSGTANQGECAIVGVDNEGNIDRTKDGHILWNGSKITIDRDQYNGYTILTNLANKRGFICFDTTKSQPFTAVVDVDVVFAYKQGGQWYYDNNSSTPVSFTPSDDYVALGWLETGTTDTVVRGGLLGEPVSLTTASFPSDVIESGTIGGITVDYNKLYDEEGAGNYDNADTGFYLDSTGRFSLKDKLAFDGTNLKVQGAVNASSLNVVDATVTGSLKASSVSAGSITVESLTQGVWNEIDSRFSAIAGSTGGFYEEDTGVFSGTQISITTGQLTHNTKDIVFQVSVDEYWADDVNFTGNQLQATLTLEYSTNGTTWNTVTDGSSNATTTLTATSYQFTWGGATSYVFYLQSGYLFTVPYAQLSTGNYYFRARITPLNATNAFSSSTYLPAGGLTFTFESNEAVSGVVATGGTVGDAATLDGIDSSQFLRSDQDDSTSGSLTVGGDLTVTGDLTINGTTTTLNTATLQVEDKNIVLNYGEGDTSASADGAGITIQDAVNSTTDASFTWDATKDRFVSSHDIQASYITLSNQELGLNPEKYSIWLDANDTDAPASLGDYYGSSPMGIYANGDADTGGGTLGSGAVQIYHTGHFSGTNISNWETAYSWGDHALAGYISTADDLEFGGDLTLTKLGTATSVDTAYGSHEIFFEGSGWSTSFGARQVGFIVRGETVKDPSSNYPNFSLAFYEGPTPSYTQKKFELYGYDTGTQDERSASFFGHVDINATSDGTGGDLKIGGTTIIDQARNLSNIGTIDLDDTLYADIIAFANSGVKYGMYSNLSARGDGNYTYAKAMYGIAGTVNSASNTSIDIDHLTGVSGAVLAFQSNIFSNTSINIDNLYGVQSEISIYNTATSNTLTIGNLYGLYAGTPTQGGSATATSAYGLYVGDYSAVGSTDNYAIYAAGGDSYLGGDLTISGTLSASGYNKSNWDTAYGWGNHAGLYPTYAESRKTFKGTSVINSTGYTTIATVTGDRLGSAIELVVNGTSNSVVINVVAKILVNHYQDIVVTSTSGIYTQINIKTVSNNNEGFAIELQRIGATGDTGIAFEITALSTESVSLVSSHSISGTTHTHTTYAGTNHSATGGSTHTIRTDGAIVASGYNSSNWDTAYTYSQVGHLPLTGGAVDYLEASDYIQLSLGTTDRQSTDYLYIGGSDLDGTDAAIYIGNDGNGGGYGWRFYYHGSGSGNLNDLSIQSENAGSPINVLRFNQDGTATFANTISSTGYKVSGTTVIDASRKLQNVTNTVLLDSTDTPTVNNVTLGLITNSTVTIDYTGNIISKINSDNSWNGQVRSFRGFTGGCVFRYSPTSISNRAMVGINTDPTTNYSYTSLDYCFYTQTSGDLIIYESGASKGSVGTYAAGDDLAIIYDNDKVRYYHNGVLVRTVDADADLTFYFDSSFYDVYDNYNNYLVFEPYVEKNDLNSLSINGATVIDSTSNATFANLTATGDLTLDTINGSTYSDSFIKLADVQTTHTGTTIGSVGGMALLVDANNNDGSSFHIRHGSRDPDTATAMMELTQTGDVTFTGSGSFSGTVTIDVDGDGTSTPLNGLVVDAQETTSGFTSSVYGAQISSEIYTNTQGVTIDALSVWGLRVDASVALESTTTSTITLDNMYSGYFRTIIADTSSTTDDCITVGSAYGVMVGPPFITGSLDSIYGLYIHNHANKADTNNYSIYSVGGDNYFGGKIDAASFEVGGTEVIDSSRNIDCNILDAGIALVSSLTIGNPDLTDDGALETYFRIYPPNSGIVGDIGFQTNGNFEIYPDGGNGGKFIVDENYVDAPSYQVSGTSVIDSSRNLTNIGTISSDKVYAPSLISVGSDSSRGVLRIAHPEGADRYSQTSSQTGAIKIKLPVSWTSTMMRMTIQVYEYGINESFTLYCGGYNYSYTSVWYNTFAQIISSGNVNRDFTVRFGHDGTNCCIFIGELDSTWSYPQVTVTDFQAGYNNATSALWASGWNIAYETTSFGTVTRTEYQTDIGTHHTNIKVGGTEVIDSSRAASFTQVGVTNIVTNKVVKFNGSILDDSNITDDGTTITLGSNTTVSGTYQVDGTTVIDASRNLTNIGSAALTGNLHILKSQPWIIIDNTTEDGGGIVFNDSQAGNQSVSGPAVSSQQFRITYNCGAESLIMGHDDDSYSGFTFGKGGNFTASGDVTAYSDERLKDNVETLDGSKVLDMRGVSFTKNGKAGSGVIAQELEKVAPELVHTADDEIGTKSVAYGNLVGYLIENAKRQQNEIDELKALVKTLMEK